MNLSFRKSLFNYQILRQMSYIGRGAGDPGQFLHAASKIKAGDVKSWTTAWTEEAQRAEALADECAANGDNTAAKKAWLAASNFYLLAEFFQPLHKRDPQSLGAQLFHKMQTTFRQALTYWSEPWEDVKIPYDGAHLDCYFFKADDTDAPRPTIISMGGLDSTLEGEVCSLFAPDAQARGYNLLAFEGPGQGAVLRLQGLPTRHDYEVPVSAAVDYLLTRPDVDPDAVILIGSSFGGYYAARAAAFEHRIRALVVHGALFSMPENIPAILYKSKVAARIGSWLLLQTPDFKLMSDKLRAVFGDEDLVKVLDIYRLFDLSEVAKNIQCPTLILHGEDDDLIPLKHAHLLYKHLTCQKDLHVANGPAGLHCQVGNPSYASAKIFSWLGKRSFAGTATSQIE